MSQPEGKRTCLYNTEQLNVVLDEMARRAALSGLGNGNGKIVIIGVKRRGIPLSEMIAKRLRENHGIQNIEMLVLEIKRYADDLTLLHPDTRLTENPEYTALDLSGKSVLLVDDVLYKGYTMLKAVQYLANKHPEKIRTMVLADREVTNLPIKADIVGVKLQVAPPDVIECNVPPYEEEFKIELLQLG